MIACAALLAFFVSAFAAPAPRSSDAAVMELAQRAAGTLYVVPHTDSIDGIVNACGLEFVALQKESSSPKERYVKLVGSFYIRSDPRIGLGYMLKLGLSDPLASNEPVLTRPANAFIRASSGKAPVKPNRIDGEPGFALYVGIVDADVMQVLRAIANEKSVLVGFNREPGRRDVLTVLDLTVTRTEFQSGNFARERSDRPVEEFLTCVRLLADEAERLIAK